MYGPQITVTRTVATNGVVITETAAAPVPDDVTLDHATECARLGSVVSALFQSLPGVNPIYIIEKCPTHLHN